MIRIAPSILSADSTIFGQEIINLQNAGADLIHFDVMDGHFVPNLTFGPKILKEIRGLANIPFDVHLMVSEPHRFIPWFADAGADILTIHIEASVAPEKELALIKNYGIKAGISLKPDTDVSLLKPYLDMVDLILVMSVEPGFGGQKFREEAPARIRKIKELIKNKNILIEVDGGINPETAQLAAEAGADILVAGTSVFYNGAYKTNIDALKGE